MTFALIGGAATGLAAQTEIASDSGSFDQSPNRPIAESLSHYRNRLTVLPYASYSPQTKVQFGVAGGYQYKLGESALRPEVRSSYVAGNLAYTTKGQWVVGGETSTFSPTARWWTSVRAAVSFFPLTYYGVGPRAPEADSNRIDSRYVRIDFKVARRIAPNLYIGPYYRLFSAFDVEYQFPGQIAASLPGRDGGVSSGLGFTIQYDARNSTTTPTTGRFLLLDYLRHDDQLGSDFGYSTLALDARTYVPFRAGKDVLALAFYGQWNGRAVPIQAMASISNITTQLVARGVYLGRYRDRHQVALQADYRGHLKGRVGYVVFGSAGSVYGSADSGPLKELKYTGGAGVRFNVNPRDPLNLRADFTVTSFGMSGLSIGAAEAF